MYLPTPEKYRRRIDEFLSDSSVHCFGAFEHENLVGILILRNSEILGVAVRKNFRRQGVGRLLIRHAAEALFFPQITAETDDDSVGFYRACGFECTKFERTYSDGISVRYNCTMNFF